MLFAIAAYFTIICPISCLHYIHELKVKTMVVYVQLEQLL